MGDWLTMIGFGLSLPPSFALAVGIVSAFNYLVHVCFEVVLVCLRDTA